jgi:hypothetical protein
MTHELKEYERGLDSFEARRELEHLLTKTLYPPSGCIPPVPGVWEKTQLAHRELFNCMIQHIREMKETEEAPQGCWLSDLEELKEIWPFDIPAGWCPPEA